MKNITPRLFVHYYKAVMNFSGVTAFVFLFLMGSKTSHAQCTIYSLYDPSTQVFHRDTTLGNFVVDTTSYHFSSRTSFIWNFSDGTTQSGPIVTHVFTQSNITVPDISYTVTVTDTIAGCVATDYNSSTISYPPVFNCSYFGTALNYSYSTEPFCGDLEHYINYAGASLYPASSPFLSKMENIWGDGTVSVDSFVGTVAIGSYYHHYSYGGVYKMKSVLTLINQFDGVACPSISTPLKAKLLDGNVTPAVVTGTLSVCEGDTIRLTAHDTTANFNNLWGIVDLAGTDGHIDTVTILPNSFYWYYNFGAASGILTTPNGDSVLVIPNATLNDTLAIFQRAICTAGPQTIIHINVTPRSLCPTGIVKQQGVNNSLNIFPSPNKGAFVVTLPAEGANVTITFADLSGKVISRIQPKNASGLQVPVDLGDVARGTYLLNISIDGKSYHDKVIVW